MFLRLYLNNNLLYFFVCFIDMTDNIENQISSSESTNSVQVQNSEQNFSQWEKNISTQENTTSTPSIQISEPITNTWTDDLWSQKSSFNIEQLAPAAYMPSEFERKRAVVMYFFIGIIVTLASESMSDYEFFHLKQSIGRRFVFSIIIFCIIVYIVIFLFIFWFMMFLPALVLLWYLWLWSFFVYSAWQGRDVNSPNSKIFMPVFADLWSRLLGIFNIQQNKTIS